jgi:transcriptional regulator with XRE-family HTH domain
MRQETRKIERTPEEKARLAAVRERFKSRPTLEELDRSGEFGPPIPGSTFWAVMALMKELRAAREAAGVSLSELADRTGMDKASLSRLESGKQGNPTIDTLARYAHALNKRMEFSILDVAAESRTSTPRNGSVPAEHKVQRSSPVAKRKKADKKRPARQ